VPVVEAHGDGGDDAGESAGIARRGGTVLTADGRQKRR
jgi:hypothetical protein